MNKKEAAEKLRNVQWEKKLENATNPVWWVITGLLVVVFVPSLYPVAVLGFMFGMVWYLSKIAKALVNGKPKTDFTATEDGDVEQEKK